jgi:hypothetical protein
MPILKDFRPVKIIELPSYPDSKVEVVDSLLVGELVAMNPDEKNPIKVAMDVLPKLIKSWNFTDEEGKALAITAENLGFLKPDDVQFLLEQIKIADAQGKKKDVI